MPLQRVLDDRKPEARAAARPRAARIDAIEALRHARNLLLGDADAGIDDLEDGAAVSRRARRLFTLPLGGVKRTALFTRL